MFYNMTIEGLSRDLPLCPLNDELYIAGFVMFGDVEITVKSAEALLKKAPEFDLIVTAESKGIPLAFEMARQAGGVRYIVCRKEKKLYMKDVVYTQVESITTDHVQTLCIDGADAEYMNGKRVLVVDDVISTGESVLSIEKLVQEAGGIIAGKMCVLAEGDAAKRDDIIYLEELPLFHPDGTPLE